MSSDYLQCGVCEKQFIPTGETYKKGEYTYIVVTCPECKIQIGISHDDECSKCGEDLEIINGKIICLRCDISKEKMKEYEEKWWNEKVHHIPGRFYWWLLKELKKNDNSL